MVKGVKMEGTRERKSGRKGVKVRHQWTELPEWWIRSVYMCRTVLVRVSLGETWEASCLCRSAKQKEPLTIHPHIYISYFFICAFLLIVFILYLTLYSTNLLTPSTAFLALSIHDKGNGHIVHIYLSLLSSKMDNFQHWEIHRCANIAQLYFSLAHFSFSVFGHFAFGLQADKDENSISLYP